MRRRERKTLILDVSGAFDGAPYGLGFDFSFLYPKCFKYILTSWREKTITLSSSLKTLDWVKRGGGLCCFSTSDPIGDPGQGYSANLAVRRTGVSENVLCRSRVNRLDLRLCVKAPISGLTYGQDHIQIVISRRLCRRDYLPKPDIGDLPATFLRSGGVSGN